ncbi:MAG: alpha-E domain-containing protein [Geminicoccaceae bacterium]
MSSLLARYAEAYFWLARYIERVESLARVLDVHESFSRDSRGEIDWAAVLALYSDEDRFFASHEQAERDQVVQFYTIDRANSGSVASSLNGARANARTLRPLLSTAIWSQLTAFATDVGRIGSESLMLGRLSPTCDRLMALTRTHLGTMDSTHPRDVGWCFYMLGLQIERADQTSRLLDVRQQALRRAGPVDQAVEASQWNHLLRVLGAYHYYRRVGSGTLEQEAIGRFLFSDPDFPRAIGFCFERCVRLLTQLRRQHQLKGASSSLERLDSIQSHLEPGNLQQLIARDLHGLNDWVQRELGGLTETIADGFWPREVTAFQSQSQSQG